MGHFLCSWIVIYWKTVLWILIEVHSVKHKLPKSSIVYTYSRLSLNGHLYKMETSVKRTLRVGPCFSLLLLFDSL